MEGTKAWQITARAADGASRTALALGLAVVDPGPPERLALGVPRDGAAGLEPGAAFELSPATGGSPRTCTVEGTWPAGEGVLVLCRAHALDAPEPAPPPCPTLVILAVADVARAAAFYRGAFGWSPRVEVPVYVELALPDGRGLGLYRRDGFARNTGLMPADLTPGEITGTELYVRCADLAGSMSRIEAAGARVLSGLAARPWGDEAAYFADPDGNVVVLARPLGEV